MKSEELFVSTEAMEERLMLFIVLCALGIAGACFTIDKLQLWDKLS